MFKTKRAYEPAARSDGERVLVDRLWPRGLRKEAAAIDLWMKDVAPSDALRKWFGHDVERWPEFARRYRLELRDHAAELNQLAELGKKRPVTLVFGAKDEEHNQAVVLQEELTKTTSRKRPAKSRHAAAR